MTASVPRASELHRLLRLSLAPVAADLGMTRTKGTASASFSRPQQDMQLTVWAQANKYRHDVLGSTFTVNVQVSVDPRPGSAGHAGEVESRWPQLVGQSGLAEARTLNDWARDESLTGVELDADLQEELELLDRYAGHGLDDAAEWDGSDVWCRYSRVEHVTAWAGYFARWLPLMVAVMTPTTR